jgi:hypothetical protein
MLQSTFDPLQDWTPLDRNWIRGRVALLDANLAAACHRGTLAAVADPTIEDGPSPLCNFDTEVTQENCVLIVEAYAKGKIQPI